MGDSLADTMVERKVAQRAALMAEWKAETMAGSLVVWWEWTWVARSAAQMVACSAV